MIKTISITLCLLSLTGCSLLQSTRTILEDRVQLWSKTLQKPTSKSIREYFSRDFKWFSLNETQPERSSKGINFFLSLYKEAFKSGTVEIKVIQIKSITKSVYVVYINILIDEHKKKIFKWRLRQKWEKKNKKWILSELKELSAPKFFRKSSVSQDLNTFTDYATGEAPLKVRRKANKMLRKIEKDHNKKLEDALKQN